MVEGWLLALRLRDYYSQVERWGGNRRLWAITLPTFIWSAVCRTGIYYGRGALDLMVGLQFGLHCMLKRRWRDAGWAFEALCPQNPFPPPILFYFNFCVDALLCFV